MQEANRECRWWILDHLASALVCFSGASKDALEAPNEELIAGGLSLALTLKLWSSAWDLPCIMGALVDSTDLLHLGTDAVQTEKSRCQVEKAMQTFRRRHT